MTFPRTLAKLLFHEGYLTVTEYQYLRQKLREIGLYKIWTKNFTFST